MVKDGLEVAGNRSAMYFGPSKSGGAFSTLVVGEVKDVVKARALMKDSLWLAEKVLDGFEKLRKIVRIPETQTGHWIQRFGLEDSLGDSEHFLND